MGYFIDDGLINVMDVISIANIVLGTEKLNLCVDINGGELINMLDILNIFNII